MQLYKEFDLEELQAIYDSMVNQYYADKTTVRNHPNCIAAAELKRRADDVLLPMITQFRQIDGIIH